MIPCAKLRNLRRSGVFDLSLIILVPFSRHAMTGVEINIVLLLLLMIGVDNFEGAADSHVLFCPIPLRAGIAHYKSLFVDK